MKNKDFCFCTLAISKKYRQYAKKLAKDLEIYSVGIPFIVLTDNPSDFEGYTNVIAFKHKPESVYIYHDKRVCLEKGLREYNSVVFLDADVRILNKIPLMSFEPGVTALICYSLSKKSLSNPRKLLIKRLAQKKRIDINNNTKYLNEAIFAVTKDNGKEKEFLKLWSQMANYLELRRFGIGEGITIGLAASKAGLKIHFRSKKNFEQIKYFKDRHVMYELSKVKKISEEKMKLYKEHRKIEYPQLNLPIRFFNKVKKELCISYRYARLILRTLKDFDLYYK